MSMKTVMALTVWLALTASVLHADTVNKPVDMETLMVNAIYAGAGVWKVNPLLLLEICRRESHLRWWAVGDFEDKIPTSFGLCGIKATTASAILNRIVMGWELMDPRFNGNMSGRIFRACLNQHGENRLLAVDCYRGVKSKGLPDIRRRRKDDPTRWILTRWAEVMQQAAWNGDLRLVRR